MFRQVVFFRGRAVTIGKDHHATLSMFLAKTQGANLVEVQALGEIAPESGCRPGSFGR